MGGLRDSENEAEMQRGARACQTVQLRHGERLGIHSTAYVERDLAVNFLVQLIFSCPILHWKLWNGYPGLETSILVPFQSCISSVFEPLALWLEDPKLPVNCVKKIKIGTRNSMCPRDLNLN